MMRTEENDDDDDDDDGWRVANLAIVTFINRKGDRNSQQGNGQR